MRPAEVRRNEIIANRKILHTLVQVSCQGYVAVFAGDPAFAAYPRSSIARVLRRLRVRYWNQIALTR